MRELRSQRMRKTKNEGGVGRLEVQEWGLSPHPGIAGAAIAAEAIPLSAKIFSKGERPVITEFAGFFNMQIVAKRSKKDTCSE